jgi:dihydroflavonol-4-reductase
MAGTNEGQAHGERVLVTGATGFIGSRLVPLLSRSGYEVRALVRTEHPGQRLVDVELFRGDLLAPESLSGIETDVDLVIHCASILGKWGTPDEQLFDVNVRGALNVLERFENSGVKRFLHLSAGGVTGPVEGGAADETYDCRPATPYEKTKLEGERRVLVRSAEMGIPALVARPTFTYGPGDPHKLALFRAIQRGRYAFIGDGESVNHPVYIDDLLRGLLLVLERGRTGEVYIVGGERPVTKRELVQTIADALGVKRPGLTIPVGLARLAATGLELLGRTLGFEPILTRSRVMMMADDFGYSIAKARRELGYEPITGLGEGIRATVAEYKRAGKL